MKRLAMVVAGMLAGTGMLVLLPTAQAHEGKAFPNVYKLNGGIPIFNVANGLLTLTGTMRAADRTHGTYKATFKEVRKAGGTVHCGGKTYHGPFTQDLKNSGHATYNITGWGTAAAKSAHSVAVFRQSGVGSSPPICSFDTGTYRFTSGRLKGKHGTYTDLATNVLTSKATETFVFH